MNDTIFALSTPQGLGAIAIIRLSGPRSREALSLCFAPKSGKALRARVLTYGHIIDGEQVLDEAMAVLLPAPATYTCEDMVELQCHGGPAVVEGVLQLLLRLPLGLRPATPGEFTRRAFEHGRLDLSRAEAVMDLLGAQSGQAASASLRQLQGSVSARVLMLIEMLVTALASLEAGLDFPEEEWAERANDEGFSALRQVLSGVTALLETYRGGRLIHQGVRIAIVGRPNVGKSSLLNALAGYERALVSAQAGTTRDVVEHDIAYRGFTLRLFDTAGMRAEAQGLEKQGMALGEAHLRLADAAILLLDGSQPLNGDDALAASLVGALPFVVALNKCDLPCVIDDSQVQALCGGQVGTTLPLSATTGQGLDALLDGVIALLPLSDLEGESITNARHAQALLRAKTLLDDALTAYEAGVPADVAALDARAALHALGEITGETLDESVIDTIFAQFCVGK